MIKGSANLCSALVLLAITFTVASDTNISHQIEELNKKLTYLQGRLDLFDYITEGNVSVLQHRVEVNESKCAENLTKQMNESNGKLNALKSKINALATTVSISVAKYSENANVQSNEANGKLNNLANKVDLLATDVNKLNTLEDKLNALATTVSSSVAKYSENANVQSNEANRKFNNLVNKVDLLATDVGKLNNIEDKLNALATAVTNLAGDIKEILMKPPSSRTDAFACPLVNQNSGVYNIQLNSNSPPFDVYCMADPKGGLPWTVVQRRVDGSVNFYRNWTEYQKGFGDLETNFFIGLDNLHSLTTKGGPQELWVSLIDRNGTSTDAYYDAFAIGNETEKYALNVLGAYSGDAGDSLTFQKYQQFSTYDKDNHLKTANCAEHFKSAWWFHDCHFHHCHHCQLNGVYGSTHNWGGLNWLKNPNDGYISKKYAHMAIRPARK